MYWAPYLMILNRQDYSRTVKQNRSRAFANNLHVSIRNKLHPSPNYQVARWDTWDFLFILRI